MIVPDVDVLLFAVDQTSVRHASARRWFEDALPGGETIGFAWSVLSAFVRLSTRPAVFERPLTPAQAFDLVEGWLAQPSVVTVDPTQRHLPMLRGLLEPLGTAGNLVPDARLAALAIEHGGWVASSDHDLARFSGRRWSDPLNWSVSSPGATRPLLRRGDSGLGVGLRYDVRRRLLAGGAVLAMRRC